MPDSEDRVLDKILGRVSGVKGTVLTHATFALCPRMMPKTGFQTRVYTKFQAGVKGTVLTHAIFALCLVVNRKMKLRGPVLEGRAKDTPGMEKVAMPGSTG